MNKFTLLFISFFIVPYFSVGQEFKALMNDPTVNFYDVVESAEKYFQENPKEEGSGHKGYQRWKYLNEPNYYPDGDRSNRDFYFTQKQFEAFVQSNKSKTAIGAPWRDLGPYELDKIGAGYSPGLGRVESFFVDPQDADFLYLGSRSGGFWKSTDGGSNWAISSTDFLVASGVNTIAVSPGQRDSVLINVRNARNSSSHGIYRSTDAGATWDTTAFNPANLGWGGLGSNQRIYEIHYHPSIKNKVYIGTSQGLYISNDNLQTFTSYLGSADITDIAFHPTADSIMYVYDNSFGGVNKNYILVSNDGGLTFTASNSLPSNASSELHISVSKVCDDCVYAASSNGVYKSTDKASNFTFISNPTGTCDGFAVDDLDTNYMIYGMLNLYGSSNGGTSFNQIANWYLPSTNGLNGGDYIHADLREAMSLNGVFYAATDGFFVKSSNRGQTWEILSSGTGIRENYAVGLSQSDNGFSICGSQDNGTSVLTPNGWLEFFGADGMEGLFHTLNSDMILSSVQFGGRYSSTDAGQNVAGVLTHTNAYWEAPMLWDPNNQMHVYSFGRDIYKSEDFGLTWSFYSNSGFGNYVMRAAIAENDSRIMAITSSRTLRVSTDAGLTFTTVSASLPNGLISSVAFSPKNDSVILVTYSTHQNNGNKIFMTSDLGATWQNITGNLGDMPLRSVVVDYSDVPNIYVGAEIGVFVKPINGGSWQLFNTALPNCTVEDLEIMRATNTIRAASWGRGLWETDVMGFENHPKIMKTKIDNTPDQFLPKAGIAQNVESEIVYAGTLSSVFVKWAMNSTQLDSVIPMSLTNGLWVTDYPMPGIPQDSMMFFQVYAVGSNGDTTLTYRFNYRAKLPVYCAAFGTANTGSDWISKVSLESIQQSSNKSAYTDFTNVYTDLLPNTQYTIEVELNTSFSLDTVYAWIDYDQDLDFEDSEYIVFSAPNANHKSFATFTTPSFTKTDTTRMRVRNMYNKTGVTPCGQFAGEVEDYSIILQTNGIGIQESDMLQAAFEIYPNPTDGLLTVEFSGTFEEGCLDLISIQGKLLNTFCYTNPEKEVLDLSSLKAGLYILSWTSENSVTNQIVEVK